MRRPSDSLMALVFLALDHGIESIRGGGSLIPFLIAEADGRRKLDRFVANTLEESLALAQATAHALPSVVSAYAIAYDGFSTVSGQRYRSEERRVGKEGRYRGW